MQLPSNPEVIPARVLSMGDMRNSRDGASILVFLLAFLLILGAGPGAAGEDEEEAAAPKILPHEPLAVAPTRPRPAAHYRHVEELVARLAKLDQWRDGIDPSSGGGIGFAPHESEEEGTPDAGLAAFRSLVALGPEAIPALLAHLDDETPTELSISHGGGFGGMWFATAIDANPACAEELKAIRAAFPGGWPDDPAHEDSFRHSGMDRHPRHVVTIGDCCFVILGHISNRAYEALSYQPTMIYKVVSPSLDARVARAVRSQWAGSDPRVELARRLTTDYHTKKDPAGGWDWDGDRQAGAAERLAFYFPGASESLLIGAIDRIDSKGADADAKLRVDTHLFLRGVSRSERPAIRAALLRLALRTRSQRTLAIALPGIGPRTDGALCDRILAVLKRETTPGYGHRGTLFFLREIARRWPSRLEPALADLLQGTPDQAQAVAVIVYTSDPEILLPIGSWMPWLVRGRELVAVESLRLCDVAALQIARQRKDLEFDEKGDGASRDAQIKKMLELLTPEYWK